MAYFGIISGCASCASYAVVSPGFFKGLRFQQLHKATAEHRRDFTKIWQKFQRCPVGSDSHNGKLDAQARGPTGSQRRNGSTYFTMLGLLGYRNLDELCASSQALRQDSRDVVQTSGDCDRKTSTLPAWLKSTVNSEKPQIIWHFSGIEMGGTAREMGRKTREIGGTPRITIFHDLFIGLSLYLF